MCPACVLELDLLGQDQLAQLGGLQFIQAAVVYDFNDFVAFEQTLALKRSCIMLGGAKQRCRPAVMRIECKAARRIVEGGGISGRLQHDEIGL